MAGVGGMPRLLRGAVLTLLCFVGLNALGAGALLVAAPSGAPLGLSVGLLSGTGLSDFLIPGLWLFGVVGVGHAAAAVLVFLRAPRSGTHAALAGLVLLGWMVGQLWLLGPIFFLQAALVVIALLELAAGFQLQRDTRARPGSRARGGTSSAEAVRGRKGAAVRALASRQSELHARAVDAAVGLDGVVAGGETADAVALGLEGAGDEDSPDKRA